VPPDQPPAVLKLLVEIDVGPLAGVIKKTTPLPIAPKPW
jgi:hypothetical protein